MGLTAVVQCNCERPESCPHESGWLASFHTTYESYGLFQDLVATLLEEGRPGMHFPLYMRGRPGRERLTYASSEADRLISELSSIRQLLSDLPIPGVRLVMSSEEFIDPIRYDARGKVLPLYEDEAWVLGVLSDRMLFLRSQTEGSEIRAGSFRRVHDADFVTDDGRKVSNGLLALGDLWEAVETYAHQKYGYILTEMIKLCVASQVSGCPVQLS